MMKITHLANVWAEFYLQVTLPHHKADQTFRTLRIDASYLRNCYDLVTVYRTMPIRFQLLRKADRLRCDR